MIPYLAELMLILSVVFLTYSAVSSRTVRLQELATSTDRRSIVQALTDYFHVDSLVYSSDAWNTATHPSVSPAA